MKDNPYIGYPKCQDCGWKWGTKITDNCSCRPENLESEEARRLFKEGFDEARSLQEEARKLLDSPPSVP